MKYFLYILKSRVTDKYYTGVTENVERRLEFHNTLERGFTSRYRPWEVVYKQEYESKRKAMEAESKVKSWKSKVIIKKIISKEIEIPR